MKRLRYIVPLAIAAITLLYVALPAGAVNPAMPSFQRTWDRTDKGIADGVYSRTWLWGPLDNTSEARQEPYAEAPGGMRTVQYYDKSRMEDNSWRTTTEPWDVSNGLLANELMTGKVQIGDNAFENRSPAEVNVAGDPVQPNGATYATFGTKLNLPAQPVGTMLNERINAAGQITTDASLNAQNITVSFVDEITKHGIAQPYWEFMNSSGTIWDGSAYVQGPLFLNPFFATGRPRTEAYWNDILVGGSTKLVLTQCFERRCLTYTPSNSELWQLEMGNIGQHYKNWRDAAPTATPTATTPVGTPTATSSGPTATSTGTAPAPTSTGTAPAPTATSTTVPATNYVYDSKLGSQSHAVNDMQNPKDIAFDSSGNMYVLDSLSDRIQKFDIYGVWMVNWGSTGNSNLQFRGPSGIAIDAADNIYIADTLNDRVQKFDSNFVFLLSFQTPPGGFNRPLGVAADTLGNIYIVDRENDLVHKYSTAGVWQISWGGFDSPFYVAVSPDNARVYVTDAGNSHVQVYDAVGNWIMNIGTPGTGDGEFIGPTGIVVSPDNKNVYVADASIDRIQRFTTLGVFEAAWGGLSSGGDPGEYSRPFGMGMMSNSAIYVAEISESRIQSIDTSDGSFNSQLTGDSRGRFQYGDGLDINAADEIVVADEASNQITVFNPDGSFKTQWTWVADTSQTPTVYTKLNNPTDVAIDSAGNIYVTDLLSDRIVKFNSQGKTITIWGATGNGNGAFNGPRGIATDNNDNVYVTDTGNDRVQKFTSDGTYLDQWGATGNQNGEFSFPTGITVYDETVYVADLGNSRVQAFSRSGVYQDQFGSVGGGNGQFNSPFDVDTDAQGYIYVTDAGNDRVQKFTPSLVYLAQFGTLGIGDGQLSTPLGIAVHANGNVSVMDNGNWRVQTFKPS